MRTTRSIAKTYCVELAPELPVKLAAKKLAGVRKGGGGRARPRKVVNNPYGNRGRKKCAACRMRKRSCRYTAENSACHFCASQGAKCGPKVLAEKARYRQKSEFNDYCRVKPDEMRPDEVTDSVVVSDNDFMVFSTREKSSTVSSAECQLDSAGLVRMANRQAHMELEEFEPQIVYNVSSPVGNANSSAQSPQFHDMSYEHDDGPIQTYTTVSTTLPMTETTEAVLYIEDPDDFDEEEFMHFTCFHTHLAMEPQFNQYQPDEFFPSISNLLRQYV